MKSTDELNRDVKMDRIARKLGIDTKKLDSMILDHCAVTHLGYDYTLDCFDSLVERFAPS